jgi:hypothetical protein
LKCPLHLSFIHNSTSLMAIVWALEVHGIFRFNELGYLLVMNQLDVSSVVFLYRSVSGLEILTV